MNGVTRAFLAAIVLGCGTAFAQPDDAATPDEGSDDTSGEMAVEEAAQPEVQLKGDIIHLRSGKTLSSVQVLRETPSSIEVQVDPSIDPLILPRRQVLSIEYDNIDPNRRGPVPVVEEVAPDVLMAQQVPESLRPKLTEPRFQGTGLSVTDRDFVVLLTNQSKRAEIDMEISEAVRAIPEADRMWSVTLPADSPFLMLLERLLQDYSALRINFTETKVVLTTKEEHAAGEG